MEVILNDNTCQLGFTSLTLRHLTGLLLVNYYKREMLGH